MTWVIIIAAWLCAIVGIVVVVGGACRRGSTDTPDWPENENDMHGGG